MSNNRILSIELRDRSVVPAEAEVIVTVVPETIDEGTEVRGRLMGPRCQFASTVEVAYHLRRVLLPGARLAIFLRAIIPEASLWEPESPHLYVGPVELWQDGVCCEVVSVRHGLRHVSLGPRGMRLNGRPIHLKGRTVQQQQACDDEQALALRQAGYNLLLVPVRKESLPVWEVADRLGFFVLGRVGSREQAELAGHLTGHPSCLGWLLTETGPAPEQLPAAPLVGCEGTDLLPGTNVLAVPAGAAVSPDANSAVLVLGGGNGETTAATEGAVVLGHVEA
jgi:hypothetical protein